ncbi:MAG TPA: hypothetical protein EYM96_03255 [Rhodospirillales bacterium]|nr:hypothetical protein [Rhodospirillales bacterium]
MKTSTYPRKSRDRHGGTYITSDNFPAQKNRCQDGVTICTGSTPVGERNVVLEKSRYILGITNYQLEGFKSYRPCRLCR